MIQYLHPEWPNDVHGMAAFGIEALQLRGDTCRPQVSAPIQKHHGYNLSIEHTGAKMRRTCTTPYIGKSPARFSILDPSVYGFKRFVKLNFFKVVFISMILFSEE